MTYNLHKRLVPLVAIVVSLAADTGSAQTLFQPPGTNLTFGDVTHGMRAQSASTNPAAAAADLARQGDDARSGAVVSGAAGLEYGNIQEIWDFYDEISEAFRKSDPDIDTGVPGQLPETKPDFGIDLGDIWDLLDPDIQDELDTIATEVARQAAILALVVAEGHAKAWITADAPVVFAKPRWGGAWTMQLRWSGTSRAFGILEPIEFDKEQARTAIQEWFDTEIAERPMSLQLGGQVQLVIDALGRVSFVLQNDSLIAFKSAQLSTLSSGYSRATWSNDAGTLYLGAEAHLHNMQMSRVAVRFGDITDSETIFDFIRDANFDSDTRASVDLGVLWVGDNYQLGAQLTSLNEPTFQFPDVNLEPFKDERVIERIQQDRTYTMERQLKLEASLYSNDRRWSWHLGVDANSAKDPLGSDYQWLTASAGSGRTTGLQAEPHGNRKNLCKRRHDNIQAYQFRRILFARHYRDRREEAARGFDGESRIPVRLVASTFLLVDS
jgi:hypothetical protein